MSEKVGGGSSSRAHLDLAAVSKRFGAIRAVDQVDLSFARGRVHALVGENGAGKSTLGKLICGVEHPTSGTIRIDGRTVSFRSPRDALAHGLVRICQELTSLPDRTVLDNVFLGLEARRIRFLDDPRESRRRFAELTARAGLRVDPSARMGGLNVAEQQKVEILRALARDASLIVMDEPTAALSRPEAEQLLEVIGQLAAHGSTVILVSHFLEDVLSVADDVTVLRDGKVVSSGAATGYSPKSLVTAMIGRPLDVAFPSRAPVDASAPVAIAVEGLAARGRPAATFSVRAGEIAGFAGLVGSGRSELMRLVFGADRPQRGRILLDGTPIRIRNPRDAIEHGIAMLPESRKNQGLHIERTVRDNVSLPHLRMFSRFGVVRRKVLRDASIDMVEHLGVQPPDDQVTATSLSGGNQQRVLFAKWLLGKPRVLIADEPTRGVDVAGKKAIYDLIAQLADQGVAVILVSSELDEVVGLSHRVLTMRGGRITAEIDGPDVTPATVLAAVFGQEEGAA